MKKITIDPITRLEGHGKIEIFINDEGTVENAYMQVPEFRGFERFCEGRPAGEMNRITSRICGVCPWAHHMASTKCLDDLYGVTPPPTALKLREMAYNVYSFYDKIINFFFLAAPDFMIGSEEPAAIRNIVGVIEKAGLDVGKRVLAVYKDAQLLLERIGGRSIHPVWGLPGGVSKGITEEERIEIAAKCKEYIEFAKFTIDLFHKVVLEDKKNLRSVTGDVYTMSSYYMGLVDENNKVNMYDGHLRVVDPDGNEYARFHPSEYKDHIAEFVIDWSYLKVPYLKNVGWKGLAEGPDSGLYRVAPLGRLNASDGMATPLAQAEYERMYDALGGKPAHHTLAYHWARMTELMYCAERALELAQDPETSGEHIRNIPSSTPREGIGVLEAPRGTLFHHYFTDEEGIIQKVNLIVATGNNYGAMCYSIKRAAQKLIKSPDPDPALLNGVEMAFRAYDPCLACATHHMPGQMPLEINIRKPSGDLICRIRR